MKILVTGVSGMMGSHLLDVLLEQDHFVIGIDNLSYGKIENIKHNLNHERFRYYCIDVRDFDSLKSLTRDFDWVVHMAAVKKIGKDHLAMDTLTVNYKGTENIFEISKMWGLKVLFASTSDVYGISPHIPFREDGDLLIGPSMVKRWSYAVSKLYGEQLAFAYHRSFGVPVSILRYFGGFSHRSSLRWSGGHIPIFVNAILHDEEVVIHGDGSQTRSMAYVSDLIEGTLLAMKNKSSIGQIINLGNDEELSVLDTVKLIHRLADTGNELKIRFIPFEEAFGAGYKDIVRRVPCLGKAKALLGYTPKVSIEKAIKIMIASFRDEMRKERKT